MRMPHAAPAASRIGFMPLYVVLMACEYVSRPPVGRTVSVAACCLLSLLRLCDRLLSLAAYTL
jgi:hypothetical protein